MGKILIFSDLHVAQHKRSVERLYHCLEVLEWVLVTARKRSIEDIVFVGDLFHDRQRIDVLSYQRTFEIFRKNLNPDNLRFHTLLGNHDLWYNEKWDVSSVIPLCAIEGFCVIDEPSAHRIAGKVFGFLPYTRNPIEDLKKIKIKEDNRVLFGHVAIHGAIWNVMHGTTADVSIEHDGDMVKVDSSIFRGWDQVFLGHYHAEQKLDFNVEYVGSPLQLNFGEAFQHKHIIVYDTDTGEKEYIRNTFSPQHFIVPLADVKKYALDKNFIRVIVDDIAASDLTEVRSSLLHEHKMGSLEIKPVIKEDTDVSILDGKQLLVKTNEMTVKFVEEVEKTVGLGELEKKKLIEIGQAICERKGEQA